MNYMNSYESYKNAVYSSLYLYYSSKEIFGKPVKRRLFKKWHNRYIRERNRNIKRIGKQNQKGNKIYFGKTVYTYHFQNGTCNKLEFTCKPKCDHSKSFTYNYARIMK